LVSHANSERAEWDELMLADVRERRLPVIDNDLRTKGSRPLPREVPRLPDLARLVDLKADGMNAEYLPSVTERSDREFRLALGKDIQRIVAEPRAIRRSAGRSWRLGR
jgi:hypothetical protein